MGLVAGFILRLNSAGREDGGIGAEVTEGMEASFSRGLEKHIFPGAGHFVHQEKPAEVSRLLLAFLEKE
jgi:pimeloyl-ACP methyl ester carboxylesterase